MSLATIEGSAPYCTPVFYSALRNGKWLAFYSKPTSRHINNSVEHPLAGASIYRETKKPALIQGLQLTGTVFAVSDSDKWEVKKAYLCSHPLAAAVLATRSDAGLYIFEVCEVILTDSARLGFGRKIIWDFRDSTSTPGDIRKS
jgi:uncharacterized protein YhbP (UPF0306 family)